jgi:TonB family protein
MLFVALVCLPAAALPQDGLAERPAPPVALGAKKANQLILNQPVPEYPPLAKVNYIQGRVRLGIEVAANGKVTYAHVLEGFPVLAASALEAVRKWTYRPLITATGPMAFVTTVEVKFSLRRHVFNLRPAQAERDLSRQVKPPQILRQPAGSRLKTFLRLHLLLNDQGQVIDCDPSFEAANDFASAQKALEGWAFRPAHWGSLPIPWYLDIEVPFNAARLSPRAGSPEPRLMLAGP